MIDVETDIFDEIARAILDEFPNTYISGEHSLSTPPMFPAVYIEQSLTSEHEAGRDSSNEENFNTLTFTISVFSNSELDAKSECKAILHIADTKMRSLNFRRSTFMPLDNASDPSITRYISRYIGLVDKNNVLYWR